MGKYDKFKVGDRVRLKPSTPAYWEEASVIKPDGTQAIEVIKVSQDNIGVVGAINVPCVRHTPGNPTEFLCVDYPIRDIHPEYKSPWPDLTEEYFKVRIRPWYHEVELVKEDI